jgi:hypothetical protein
VRKGVPEPVDLGRFLFADQDGLVSAGPRHARASHTAA